ncbi:exodeoxyribonuclease III [Piscinibacter gummiphilus]|uniref:Exodeoxyribonuclease III n=1 Tax=Piscinibacter gummiphilus TaxID=946333 RepID=A0ABZ0CU38_9BURK|nr:exodeoxyribonuclease III [Piscinibacter gummiphilus]WOB08497.1 exodeoxyribonuclease III [Piscinibacter gummiphilus]
MFRLVSLNLNGIRSAATKGLLPWAEALGADCMGVQEIKAQAADIAERFDTVHDMTGYFHFAEKKGYSGVGLYTRKEPSDVVVGIGAPEFDAEGRYIECRFDTPSRKLSIISCYFPSGSSGEERHLAKFRFLALMTPWLQRLKAEREFILVGDINIAHKEIDLKNWKGNQKNSGFLPEERAWMTHCLDEIGLVDVFRRLNDKAEQYTWWSNRGQAYAKNVGWRLDYHLATPGIAALARKEHIFLDQRFSDHAPLIIDYDFTL